MICASRSSNDYVLYRTNINTQERTHYQVSQEYADVTDVSFVLFASNYRYPVHIQSPLACCAYIRVVAVHASSYHFNPLVLSLLHANICITERFSRTTYSLYRTSPATRSTLIKHFEMIGRRLGAPSSFRAPIIDAQSHASTTLRVGLISASHRLMTLAGASNSKRAVRKSILRRRYRYS